MSVKKWSKSILDNGVDKKIVHCPGCNGVILKIHEGSGIRDFVGEGDLNMRCPHCQEKVKIRFADLLVTKVDEGE